MAAKSKKEETDIFDLLKDLVKNWHIMLPCIILSGIMGVFAAMWIRPVYQADALVQIENKTNSGMIGAMMGGLGSLFANSSPAETEIELIKSRQIIGDAIDKMHLQYYAIPTNILQRILHKEGRMELHKLEIPWKNFPKKEIGKPWFAVVKDSLTFDVLDHNKKKIFTDCHAGETYKAPYAGDTVTFSVYKMDVKKGQRFELFKIDRLDAIEAFKGAFDIQDRGKKTGVLEFSYTDIYPDRATAILNEIANNYLRQNVERSNIEAQKTLNVLEEQLPEIKAQMDSAMHRFNTYQKQVGSVDINAETRLVLERRNKLQQELFNLQQKKQDAIRLFQPEHPTIKTYEEQENAIKRELANNGTESKRLPTKQQEVLKLSNEVEMAKVTYTSLLNNIQQLKLVSAGEAGTVRIIDYAEALPYAIKPKKKMIIGVALFLGILFGIALVSVRRKFGEGVRDPDLLERATGLSVYAKVPKTCIKTTVDTVPLAVSNPNDVSIKALQALRSSLEFLISEGASPIVGISCLAPGAGQVFISENLASLFAISGKKTLLVDADLRKGHLAKKFGIDGNTGLSQILLHNEPIDSAICKTTVENLELIPCGAPPSNPAELLSSKRYLMVIEELAKRYDLVVINTPSLALAADAISACRAASQIAMVLESKKHSIEAIKNGAAQLRMSNADAHVSVVLNKC